MELINTLESKLDASVNFIFSNGQEARYVSRKDDYFIVYLSSHGGCNQACRFCHLTQTKQVEMIPTTKDEFLEQAKIVIGHYRKLVATNKRVVAHTIHFNWMARGEPLLNKELAFNWCEISDALAQLAQDAGILFVKFKISTIYPVGAYSLENFVMNHPGIYYSAYSANEDFRKRWLPKAKPIKEAIDLLRHHQLNADMKIRFHWALIKGENDSVEDADKIGRAILNGALRSCKFNLVRYNPYSPAQGVESDDDTIELYLHTLSHYIKGGIKIIPRVGPDVFASCGKFVVSATIRKVVSDEIKELE